MAAKAPTDEELKAAAGKMKKAETKEAGGGVAPEVIAAFKKAYTDNGGDKAKTCKAMGLEEGEWKDISDADSFCMKYLGAK